MNRLIHGDIDDKKMLCYDCPYIQCFLRGLVDKTIKCKRDYEIVEDKKNKNHA